MKSSNIILLTLFILASSFTQAGWSQEMFVEHAPVLVTAEPSCIGKDPWLKPPGVNGPVVLNRGWYQLTAATTTKGPSTNGKSQRLPLPLISLPSGKQVEFYVYIFSDHRGRTTGRPGIKLSGKKIVISIGEKFSSEPKTPVFEPSLWYERVTVANLTKGVYQVYLHSTPAGKISIP